MACVIRKCDCKHPMQDGMYGAGRRVFNPCKDGKEYRCTICGKMNGTEDRVTVKKVEKTEAKK